jgi:diguanylate cyclase (GGDEF)-like protein
MKQHGEFGILQHRAATLWTLALFLIGCVFIAHEYSKRFALRQVERALDGRLEAHKLYFLDNLGKYALLPEAISVSPTIHTLLKQPNAKNVALANRMLTETAAHVAIDRIWVLDSRGVVIADSLWADRNTIIGRQLGYRAYFQEAMAGRTGHFIGVGSLVSEPQYFVSRPVGIDGKVQGVVVIRLSAAFKKFEATLRNNWKERGELALEADENGLLFISAIPGWTFKAISPKSADILNAARDSRHYGNKDFISIAMTPGAALSEDLRFVRFGELPGRTFIQRSYPMPETGGTTYLHVDAREYRNAVAFYTGSALLAATVIFLAAFVILDRWRNQRRLVEAAIRDPLTGLHTRLYMQEWLQDAISTHSRHHDRTFALLLFDIDHFKAINDTHGHLVGDEALREIARIIANAVRADDLVVRFGGEEIAVFARTSDAAMVEALGERIRQQVEQHGVQTSCGHIAVTLSGGIAQHAVGESQTDLFERADKKLYEAKFAGRNRVFSQSAPSIAPASTDRRPPTKALADANDVNLQKSITH